MDPAARLGPARRRARRLALDGAANALERARPRTRARSGSRDAAAKKSWKTWSKQLATAIYRDHALELWKCRKPKLVSRPGESEGAFRGRVADALRAERDLKREKLRKKFTPKLARHQEKIDRALERVEREEEQYKDRKTQTVIQMGATLVGALFGRKVASVGNVRRAASSMKGVSRAAREKADIGRAEARVEEYQAELVELEQAFEEALAEAEERFAELEADAEIEPLRVAARKADLDVERLGVVWVPVRQDARGGMEVLAPLA